MTEREVSSERVSEERVYLIRKGGAWYRPDSAGYTTNAHEAGRYTLEEAEKITHPNGPNGPRDAMSYQHQDAVPVLRSSVKTVDEELLIDNAATASQNRTLIDDPVTREAIKLNIINPLLSSVKTGTRVKDLEWELMGGDSWRAPALFFGSFRVESYAEGYVVLWSAPGIADTFVGGRWPNAEAAKSAAQADYERRVLSALASPTPQEAPSEVTDEMIQKAWEAYDAKSGYSKPERFRAALIAALKGGK